MNSYIMFDSIRSRFFLNCSKKNLELISSLSSGLLLVVDWGLGKPALVFLCMFFELISFFSSCLCNKFLTNMYLPRVRQEDIKFQHKYGKIILYNLVNMISKVIL